MGKIVLIVDDIDANLMLLRTILKHKGFEVLEAMNGQEGLDIANKTKPDLIVSDILMPVMDGFAFCKECKSQENLRDIPFVFYTATYTEKKDAEFALSLGAAEFLIKPLESHEFIKSIINVLDNESNNMIANIEPSPDDKADESFYKIYNSRLIHKLEDKLVELEIKNGALLEKEKEIRHLNAHLEEKVKLRTQELTRLNEDLASFNYSVSHDLRAPLRHICGFTKLLLEDYRESMSEDIESYLKRISNAGQKLDEIINALLRLSKVKLESISIEYTNLSRLVEKTLDAFSSASEERKAEFIVQPDVYVDGDPELLQVLMENLLSNAWKFCINKEITKIEFGFKSEKGNKVYYISDNGAGFNQQFEKDLFKPFKRLHKASEFDGMGIGLATVKKVIDQHHGDIWATSDVDGGANFYFTLNAGDSEQSNV